MSFRGFDTQSACNLVKPFQSQPWKGLPKENMNIGAKNVGLVPTKHGNIFSKNASVLEPNLSSISNKKWEQSNDNLDEIHSKLHDDLIKIKTWKVNVEHELKQKTRKIEASSQIIESQRKSILDLQLENETISSKLKEELDARTDCDQKLRSTRELMLILKEQFGTFEEKVNDCRNIKIMFDEINEERSKGIETIVSKFENLATDYTEKVDSMSERYMMQEAEKTQMQTSFYEQENELQKQIITLRHSIEIKENDLQKFKIELANTKLAKSVLEKTNEEYLSNISLLEAKVTEKSDKLDALLQKVTILSSEKQQLDSDLQVMKDDIESKTNTYSLLVEEFDLQKKKLDKEGKQWGNEKEELVKQLTMKSNQYAEIEKELKASVNTTEVLKRNIDLLNINIAENKKQGQDLQAIIDQNKLERNELLENKAALESNLEESNCSLLKCQSFETELIKTKLLLQDEYKITENLRCDLDVAIGNAKMHQECSVNLKGELKGLLDDVASISRDLELKQTELAHLNKTNIELTHKLSEMHDEEFKVLETSKNNKNELTSLTNNFNTLQEEKMELEKKLELYQSEITSLTTRLDESFKEITEKASYISKLQQKMNDTCASQTSKSILTCQEISNLESKMKSLRDELSNNSRRLKEVEKINVSLEKTLAAKTKNLSKSSEDINDLCKKLKEKSDDISAMKKEMKSVNQQFEDSKKQVSKSLKDLQEAKSTSESKINEFFQLLEKSESSSNKTIMEKERELQKTKLLLEKLQQQIRFEEHKDLELKQLRDEVVKMKEGHLENEKHAEQLLALETENRKQKEEFLKLKHDLQKETEMNLVLQNHEWETEKENLLAKKCEWEAEKETLLAKCETYRKAATIPVIQTPLMSRNNQFDTPKTALKRTPMNQIEFPNTTPVRGASINSTPKVSRSIFPSTPKCHTPTPKMTPSNTQGFNTPATNFSVSKTSNSYIASTPKTVPTISQPRLNYSNQTPNDLNNSGMTARVTPKPNAGSLNPKDDKNTYQRANSTTPSRGVKMTPNKHIPIDLEFDSDSSSTSVGIDLNTAIKILDRKVNNANSGPSLKRKSPIITKQDPPTKPGETTKEGDFKKNEKGIFSSLNSKKLKQDSVIVKQVDREHRKFFKSDRKAGKPLEKSTLSWLDNDNTYSLFSED